MSNKAMYWETVSRQIEACSRMVEGLILTVPTGEARNKLTAANIHLLTAKETFDKAIKNAKESDDI